MREREGILRGDMIESRVSQFTMQEESNGRL